MLREKLSQLLSILVCTFCIQVAHAQVGVGTITPAAPLNVHNDSTAHILFTNSATGITVGDGLLIGNNSNLSNKGLIWNYENAPIGIATNNLERLTISASGNVGIGITNPTNKLHVNGTVGSNYLVSSGGAEFGNYIYNYGANYTMGKSYFTGGVEDPVQINTPTIDGVLAIKGSLAYGNWGQHLILESSSTTDYGGILYDTDGMKFRNFGADDNFYFRNSANSSTVVIDDVGNLTVNAGKGIVRSDDAGQKVIAYAITPANLNISIAAGALTSAFTFNFGETFTSPPAIAWGPMTGITNPGNIIMTVESIGNSSASVRFKNVGSTTSVATNATVSAMIIGKK